MGEDARKIDWKSTAKTGEPHIKLFYEEKDVTIALCALMSGSLLFKNKRKTLLQIAAKLSYQTLKTANTLVPIMIAPNETLLLPPSKKSNAVEHFIKKSASTVLENGSLETEGISSTINRHLHQKSFVLMIGDFLGDFDFSLLSSRHEIHLIMIRDSFEENPHSLGEGSFVDPESGESAEFYFGKSACDAYAKRYHDNDQKLIKHLQSLGITYKKVLAI